MLIPNRFCNLLFRFSVCYLAVIVGVGCFSSAGFADGFEPDDFNPAQFEEYERKLNAILKTRRDEEKAFVAAVVEKVKTGKLPSQLVQTSFQWARNERPDTNYPFIYFERVLRLQAGKIDLAAEVPPFDYSIYGSAGQRINGQNLNAGQKTEKQETALLKTTFFRLFPLFR